MQLLHSSLSRNFRILSSVVHCTSHASSSSSFPAYRPFSSNRKLNFGPNPNYYSTMATRFPLPIEQSPNDKRSYRLLALVNGLEVMLIHDGLTDKAAVSLSVGVGHLNDPDDLPGLAHFCEHLLFLGTEKYPIESEYKIFLSQNAGSSNAFTSTDETNYYLDCSPSALPGALSRQSQFFISPLFDPASTTRELNAVDSEFRKNLQLDERRLFQLGKATSSRLEGAKYWKFGTGSKDTLGEAASARGEDIRERLISWYKEQYSSNLMKLVVLSSQSLDELEELVVKEYSAVPNKNLVAPYFGVPPLGFEELQTLISYRTIKNIPKLRIEFPFPDQRELWATGPARFISHFLGHEGPNSILAELKQLGWASSLSAGGGGGSAGYEFFRISATLTSAGLINYKRVVQIIFQYLDLLRSTPPQEWSFREMETLSNIAWRYKETGQPSSTVKGLSSTLQSLYPREKILSAGYSAHHFDEQLLKSSLDNLSSKNCRIFLGSQKPLVEDQQWNLVEQYYGTEYSLICFREDHWPMSSLDLTPKLALPQPNPFIPEHLDILPALEGQFPHRPTLIRETPTSRLFYKKDDQWKVPRATAYFLLQTPLADDSASSAMKSQVFTCLVEESLAEITYESSLAGLNYSVGNEPDGLQVVVSGYSDKLSVLLNVVLEKLKNEPVHQTSFVMIHERLTRAYLNAQLNNPSSLADTHIRHFTRQTHWTYEDRLHALDGMKPEDIRVHANRLLSGGLPIESMVHGNISKKEALSIIESVESSLKSNTQPAENDYHRALILPPGSNLVYQPMVPSPENVNSAISVFYQVGPSSNANLLAQLHLFAQIAKVQVFSTLRTKEQLGYIVQSSLSVQNGMTGFKVLVQSEKTAGILAERIESFWSGFGKYLEEMNEKEFEKEKASLISKRLEKVKNLGQETMRYWNEIECGRLDFNYREKSAEAISLITKEAIIKIFETYISSTSPSRTQLAIQLRSHRIQSEALLPLSQELNTILVEPVLSEFIVLINNKPTLEQIKKFITSIEIPLPNSIEELMSELEQKPSLPVGVREIEDIETFRIGLERADRVLPIDDYRTDLLVKNLSHL